MNFSTIHTRRPLRPSNPGNSNTEIAPITIDETYYDSGKRKQRSFVVDPDEGPRKDTSIESLSGLKPAFKLGGLVTAGNSSQTSDGAGFVIVMSERLMKELGLEPEARIITCASAGVNADTWELVLVEAVPKAIERSGIQLKDIDIIRIK